MESWKVELVKSLLKRIHEGADPESLKREFGEVLAKVSPIEIPLIEQQLVREGVPIQEILRMCDLHVALFRERAMAKGYFCGFHAELDPRFGPATCSACREVFRPSTSA